MPGSFWKAGVSEILPSDNSLGIPVLERFSGRVPGDLVAYGARRDRIEEPGTKGLHFFLDDYRFERVWNFPMRGLEAVRGYGCVLSPDFSVYRDWPRALQVWNVYRSRWLGAWWQRNGVDVVPTVSWGGAETWDFCFLGVPRGCVVAVSTVGVMRSLDAREGFVAGFEEMVRRLAPELVICYGQGIGGMEALAEVVVYPGRWDVGSSYAGPLAMK